MDALAERDPSDGFDAQVAAAQRELHEGIVKAGLQRDAYRYPIMAYSVALGVLPAFINEISKFRQPPITADAVQALNKAAAAAVAGELPYAIKNAVLQQFKLWALAGGVGFVLAVAAGFAGGWFYRGPAQIVAGITGGAPRCDDQQDGSRLCWIPVYERPAPGKGR